MVRFKVRVRVVVGLGLGLIIPTCRANLVLRVIWQCNIFGMTPGRSVIGQPDKPAGCYWLLIIAPFRSGFHPF